MATILETATLVKRLFLASLFSRHGEALTPCISGYHGIGKSQTISEIARSLDCRMRTIEATVMKEGEITGLPFAMKNGYGEDEVSFIPYYAIKEIQQIEKDYYTRALTDGFLEGTIKADPNANDKYDVQNVFKFAEDLPGEKKLEMIEKGEIKPYILFIDEINRVDDIVLKELMNIILNKNINGYQLPWWVFICTAINPAGQDSNYATREMDPAQLDRFFIFKTSAKLDDWVDYAITHGHDSEVINAIAVTPEIFQSAEAKKISKVEMTPSPRSWSMVDTVYRSLHTVNRSKFFTAEEKKGVDSDFFQIAAAKVGETSARTLISNMQNVQDNVLPSDILNGKDTKIEDKILEKLKSQKAIRRKLTMNNVVGYICETYFDFEKDKTANGKKKFLNYIEQMKQYISVLDDTTKMVFAKKIVDANTVVKNGNRTIPLLQVIGKYFAGDLLKTITEIKADIKSIGE